jgi:putative selenate reductase
VTGTTTRRGPALSPFPLGVLLGRIAHEWETRQRIFDLPAGRFFDASAAPDLSVAFLGRPAATPIGPASGPHTQLAENIVLAWLGGARIVELKTVQVLDELEISRPCIDMETVGYNVEWSQELRIGQSLEEYVKAWMIIVILRGWDELTPYVGADPGPHVFDLSVGYDLAGISSDGVAAYIDGLVDARDTIERLRPQIPERFAAWRDHPFPTRVAGSVTVSTFHGCPPDEIASISRHLMTRHGLDVVVKLNPTLLGFERVAGILSDELGYDEIRLRRPDFDADLSFPRALGLIDELDTFARARGRRFGIKLTNTLVVGNHRGFLPGDPMYLSGPPLHVLSMTLLDEIHRALPGRLVVGGGDGGEEDGSKGAAGGRDGGVAEGRDGGPGGTVAVSFSAGVTKRNLPALAGLGLAPITVCSDLLRPGGYGRIRPMLAALADTMREAGCADLPAWRAHRTALATAAGHADPIAACVADLHDGTRNGDYTRAGTDRPLRRVDHVLERWGCVACNVCVTVCPNDAFFRVPTPAGLDVPGDAQYLLFAELCNRCGNCMVFCPEEGDPATVKPALFLDPERFSLADRPGFLLSHLGRTIVVTPGPGQDADAGRLAAILEAPEGLPLDPLDLASAGA